MNAITKRSPSLPTAAGGQTQQEPQQYLTFIVAGETYAIGILCIKEIIEYGQLTEVPRMPAFIRGVINLRGAVVPVIDMSSRFGKPSTSIGRRTCIIIIEVVLGEETQDVGVVVDEVNEVLEIPVSEIEPAPSFGANIRTDFISGMGKLSGRFVIILNVQYVLSIDEMSALVAVGSADAMS